jgi:hypothetical protein
VVVVVVTHDRFSFFGCVLDKTNMSIRPNPAGTKATKKKSLQESVERREKKK